MTLRGGFWVDFGAVFRSEMMLLKCLCQGRRQADADHERRGGEGGDPERREGRQLQLRAGAERRRRRSQAQEEVLRPLIQTDPTGSCILLEPFRIILSYNPIFT